MTDPRVIIVGGNPGQLYQVTEVLGDSCAISILPPRQVQGNTAVRISPSLILLIPEGPFPDTLPILETLRKQLPQTPVIMIGEAPEREDIIQAFRFGVKDYLLFPIKAPELLYAIKKHGKAQSTPLALPFFKKWSEKFSRWLGAKGEEGHRQTRPGPNVKANPAAPLLDPGFLSPRRELPAQGIEACFFGNFQFRYEGESLPLLPGEKVNALFAYLLYNHQKPVHREIILSKFWEYTSPASARKSLNVAMYTLRQHLNSHIPDMEIVQYYNDNYTINPELEITTDVGLFLGHWRKGRAVEANQGPAKALEHYQKAAALYRGDFLEAIHYEEWCEMERDNLKETYLILLDRLGTYFLQEKACAMAGKVFKKMLEKDDCLENAHRKLILCYYHLGRRDKAIRQYYKCTEALEKELNIGPSASTRELFELICQDKERRILQFLV